MAPRTPTIADVAALNRADWEALCAGLVSLVYQAHRVEDKLGRGNGLDGWRLTPSGIEGFQHRRLDGRFGDTQVSDLKVNIKLAATRCVTEMHAPLRRYHVLLNIDLQPGHKGVKGEIERWQDLDDWAHSTHGVGLEFHGVTWVHTRLTQFPHLRPELFEDVARAVAEANEKLDAIGNQTGTILSQLATLVESKTEGTLKELLRSLAREARTHFDRGLAEGNEEEYTTAIVKLEDARRLLELGTVDEALRGHVLLLLCGIRTLVGQLAGALGDGELALRVLAGVGDLNLLRLAKGNVAMALYRLQRYDEARVLCEDLLLDYEREGNLTEVVRILQHLAELSCNAKDIKAAMMWADRLKAASDALVDVRGCIDELTLGAFGTAANVFLTVALTLPDPLRRHMLTTVQATFLFIEKTAAAATNMMTALLAREQRARVLWNLDDLESASALFVEVIAEAEKRGFGKLAADAQFNRAILLSEQGMGSESKSEFLDARRRYAELGDDPSVADVDRMLDGLGPR